MKLTKEPEYSFHYETEANASFLVAELGEETPLVQYQMKMLENNHIAHLLDAQKYQQDETVKIRYNVTGRMSLAQVTEREKIQREEFLTLLAGLLECYEDLSEYQLSAQGLLLDDAYIFVRTGGFEPDFIFLPIFQEDGGLEGLRRFVREMVMNSRLASTNDNFIQRLLDTFNDQQLTLESLQKEVAQMRRPAAPPPAVEPPRVPVFDPVPADPVPSAPSPAEEAQEAAPPKKKGRKPEKGSKKPKEPKEKNGSSKGSILFTALQAVLVLVLALAVKSGFFFTEAGTLNVSYVIGCLIAAAGLDVVVYRELFVNNKKKTDGAGKAGGKKPAKAGAKKPPKASKVGKEPKAGKAFKGGKKPEPAPAEPVREANPAPAAPVSAPVVSAPPPVQALHTGRGLDMEPVEDTVVMGADGFGTGYLEYFENGLAVRIHLNQDVTRVGSRAQSVDHVLLSHKVSKVHAEFIRRNGRYFMRDINSTNGTYLNGSRERIVSNQEIELHDGDRVRLADVELVFKC